MPTLICPYCENHPSTSLHRFLPRTRLARETFTCSLCGKISEFSPSAANWSIAAGTAGLVVTLLALRLIMSTMGTNHIPMSTLGAAAFFVSLLSTYQIPAALMLRHKAVLFSLPTE